MMPRTMPFPWAKPWASAEFVTQREAALAFDRRARQIGRGTNFRADGTCNELGKKGKVLTQVEEGPAS